MLTRFAILSDVHLPAPGSGPTANALADLLRLAVEKIRSLDPAWVILLGDTVEFGTAEEYALAKEIVKPILPRVKSLAGNHEILKGTAADFRAAWIVEPAVADLIDNFPVMRFNTGVEGQAPDEYFGRITPPQLQLFNALLDSRSSLPALIFSHHPLRNTVRRSDEPNFAVENSQPVRDRLSAHRGGAVIFSGHTHWQSVVRLSDSLTCIGCPPLGFWPHAFLMAEFDGSKLRYETIQLIDSVEASPDPERADATHRSRALGGESDRAGVVMLGGQRV